MRHTAYDASQHCGVTAAPYDGRARTYRVAIGVAMARHRDTRAQLPEDIMRPMLRLSLSLVAVAFVQGCTGDATRRLPTAPPPAAAVQSKDRSDGGERENSWRWSSWSAPINMGYVVNSADSDSHPAISRNQLTLYISSHRSDLPGAKGGFDIWVSHRADLDSPWETPVNLGDAINTGGNEMAPNLTLDGRTMYFHRNPGVCGGADIFVSHRRNPDDDFGWEPAQPILPCGAVNSAFSDAGPTIFEDRRMHTTVLYFTRQVIPGPGGFDVFVDTLGHDGSWGVASVVPELTSPFRDTRTTISRNGLEMFISSGRPGGVGSEDIWVSTRSSTSDVWGTPVNAGAIINSSAFDGAPALSFDGTTLYFFSERTGPDANGTSPLGLRDLYVSTRTRLGGADDEEALNLRPGGSNVSLTRRP